MRERSVDVAIVGSGAGGATVASELAPLAEAGRRVAVFEKGPRLRDEEFTGLELEMARALYADGGGFLTAEGTMTLAFAETYGGSTAVYTGTSLLPPERRRPAPQLLSPSSRAFSRLTFSGYFAWNWRSESSRSEGSRRMARP